MKYGLIGEKLGHSFSKEIHEKIATYDYELCEVSKNEFNYFMKERNFKAINVTIPYKEQVIPYLFEIDDIAKKIGAVNTIVNKNGRLYGYNTDYYGLKNLITRNEIDVANKKVLIMGTGGTSKTAKAVVKDLGAKEIIFVSINREPYAIGYDEVLKSHLDVEVIINTTPCGMYPNNDDLIIDIDSFDNLIAVCDVVYNPLLTSLLQKAKSKNIKYAGGLYMLVSQAVYASCIFEDKAVNNSLIDKTYYEIFNEKKNIILIGMPSCGKTTIGKILAQKMGKKFIDTDTLIEEKIKMPIKEFLNVDNENEFRTIETSVVKEIAKLQNLVIATGGGIIKRDINIKRLKQNGKVIFIDRDLELLIPSDDRPLSNNFDSLKKIYDERYPVYLSVSDLTVKNNDDIMQTISKLLKEV